MFIRAFYKTWTFYKNGLASLDLLFGKDIQAVLLIFGSKTGMNVCPSTYPC